MASVKGWKWRNHQYAPIALTDEASAVITGSLLGDAWLRMSTGSVNAYFGVSHSIKDLEYLSWKREMLAGIGLVKSPISFLTSGKGSAYGTFWTICHPLLTELYQLFYPKGVKTVSLEILGRINPLALAVWWMDDGNFYLNKKRFPDLELETQGFTRVEVEQVKDWLLSKFNVACHLVPTYREGDGYRIRISSTWQAEAFLNIVRPWVIPEMSRKIGGANWHWVPKKHAPLSPQQISTIRALLPTRMPFTEIAREVECTRRQVGYLINRK